MGAPNKTNVKKEVTFTCSTIEKDEKHQLSQQPFKQQTQQNMIVMRAPTPAKRFNFDNQIVSPDKQLQNYSIDNSDYDIRNVSTSYRSETPPTSPPQQSQETTSIILTPRGTRITKSNTSIDNSNNKKRRDHHHLRIETSSTGASNASNKNDTKDIKNTTPFDNLAQEEAEHRRDTPVAQLT